MFGKIELDNMREKHEKQKQEQYLKNNKKMIRKPRVIFKKPESEKQQPEGQNTQQQQQQQGKNRIIVTNIGVNLMSDVDDEVKTQKIIQQQEELRNQQTLRAQNDESCQYISQILKENNQKTNQSINEKVVIAALPATTKNRRSMENLFERDIDNELRNKGYMKKQISKYSKQLMKPGSQPGSMNSVLQRSGSSTILGVGAPGSTTNILNSYYENSMLDSRQYQNMLLQDDQYALDKYNKVLFIDSKLDHIQKRYQSWKHDSEELKKRLRDKYTQVKQDEYDYLTGRNTDIEEDLGQEEHRQVQEILKYQSQYEKRREKRNMDFLKGKYLSTWNRYQLPKLTQKSVENHQRFEKYKNRNIQ